jgi:integrase
MKLKLDARTVAGLTLTQNRREDFAWDTELEGFGFRLRRGAGGLRRTYVAQYRAGGRTRRSTLGSFEKLTAPQAREAARKILARVALGRDPQAEKAAERVRAERTFSKVVDAYLAARQSELRPASFRVARLYLTGAYFRPLHAMSLGEISRSDIAARLSAITRSHSAYTAAAARRAASMLFGWAVMEGWCEANPVIGTRKPNDPTPRDRVLADDELVAIWRACDDGSDYNRIIRLLILLGSRRGEIGGMCWSELDFEAGVWSLPASRSKNRRGCTVCLPAAALAILEAIPRGGRDYLFGGRTGSGFTSWERNKQILDRRLDGIVQPWRLHDVRRSVASKMGDLGIEPHLIELVLNHSAHRSGTGGIYNRSPYARAVAAALAKWSAHVAHLVEGRTGKIVAFPS